MQSAVWCAEAPPPPESRIGIRVIRVAQIQQCRLYRTVKLFELNPTPYRPPYLYMPTTRTCRGKDRLGSEAADARAEPPGSLQ